MSAVEKLRGSVQWVFAGNFSGRILEFIFGVILARILLPSDFGMIVTVQIFTGIAGLVAGGGLGEALIQAKELKKNDYSAVFSWQLLIGVLIFSIIFVIAPYFAVWFEDPVYESLLKISAASFLLRPFSNVLSSKLRREMDFKVLFFMNFSLMIVVGVVSIVMAMAGFGVWSLVWSGLIGSMVNIIILYWYTGMSFTLCFDKDAAKRLGGYGIRLSGCGILTFIRDRVPIFLISKNIGTTSLGLYNKADSLGFLPMAVIGTAAFQPLLRAIAEEQDNLDRVKYLYYRSICLVSVYTLPFYVGLWWVAESFVLTVYGEQWRGVILPLMIFSLTGPLRCVNNPSAAVIRGINLVGKELRILIEVIFLLVIACFVGLDWGIVGVAWAFVLTFFYQALRMSNLVLGAINGTVKELLIHLKPSLILNGIMFINLMIGDFFLNSIGVNNSSWLYLLSMALYGGIVYGVLFLFAPIKMIENESKKWRSKLKIHD